MLHTYKILWIVAVVILSVVAVRGVCAAAMMHHTSLLQAIADFAMGAVAAAAAAAVCQFTQNSYQSCMKTEQLAAAFQVVQDLVRAATSTRQCCIRCDDRPVVVRWCMLEMYSIRNSTVT
jgi:hypothetical protein